MDRVILASTSPRRHELLKYLLPSFRVIPPSVVEKLLDKEDPKSTVKRLASEKAKSVSVLHKEVIIGADTVVVFENKILGKPQNANDALRMLTALQGHTHSVITGIAVIDAEGELTTNSVQTDVEFRDYTMAEMESYIDTGDPMDKAGAYAIQHPQFRPARRISGCYFNVVGLPLCALSKMLTDIGISIEIESPAEIPNFCLSSDVCPLGKAV